MMKWIIIVFLLCALIELLCAAVTHLFSSGDHDHLRASRSQWTPYSYWRKRPYSSKRLTIDANGLRRTLDGNGPTVWMFGGSLLWGDLLSDEETVASRLAIRGYSVVNFAQCGYVSAQGLAALHEQLRGGVKPDVVVFVDGVNDVMSALRQDVAGLPLSEHNRATEFELWHDTVNSHGCSILPRVIWRWATHRSHVSVCVRRLLRFKADKRSAASVTVIPQVMEKYEHTIRMLRATAREYGFECLAYWQPCVVTRSRATNHDQKILSELGARTATAFVTARNIDKTVADLSDIFNDTDQEVYIDYCHVTSHGAQMIADRIHGDIKQGSGR